MPRTMDRAAQATCEVLSLSAVHGVNRPRTPDDRSRNERRSPLSRLALLVLRSYDRRASLINPTPVNYRTSVVKITPRQDILGGSNTYARLVQYA